MSHTPDPALPHTSTTTAPDGAAAPTDVRVQRTRNRLREAVLELASTQPVEDIAVADLVRAARINRTTFYKHAGSPAEVLKQLLYEDLDRVRVGWLEEASASGLSPQDVWEHASAALVDHLERYDAVYTVGLTDRHSTVLHYLLVDHFTASVRTLLDHNRGAVPAGAGSLVWRTEAASRFLAHGEAGLVEAWMSLPAPRDRSLFVSAAAALLPSWLVLPRP
ncbi:MULTISPECIES: TetR/AcrR family transcriptional regulator [unclassified Streptomyces]|uniref:TetR/AcrR family transcriptional regulator n=1 Tax=unclassified Streptomyces TaxID=2593676 RepID=UPI0015ECCB8E|nr:MULTISPECIES: TetR/AcrR family transcriptional regulator [unclassified Streptomyces]